MNRVLDSLGPGWLILALVVNGLLILYTATQTLQTFPNSADEYAYLLSANLFSEGKLSVPSPEPRESFQTMHVVNDGHYYGKYSPGWPALLTLGVKAGVPWAVNLVLGLLALALFYFLARKISGPRAANLTMALFLLNPFFIFNSASYFAHPACLLVVLLAVFCLFFTRSPLAQLGFGAAAGAAFLIRPFTALIVLAPPAALFLTRSYRDRGIRSAALGLAGMVTGFLPFFGLFLFYNWAQTGDPFLQPFTVYDPQDHLGFGYPGTGGPLERFHQNILSRLVFLTKWTAFAPVLALGLLLPGKGRKERLRRGGLLLIPLLALLIGHYFYWGSGVNQYGPRYLYESLPFLLLAAALGLSALGRWMPLALACVVALNGWKFFQASDYYRAQVAERTSFFRQLREGGLPQALVFLRTGSATLQAGDLVRNRLDFNDPVLLALDRGSQGNAEAIRLHPGRALYVYTYDFGTHQGRLEPYRPETADQDRRMGWERYHPPGGWKPPYLE